MTTNKLQNILQNAKVKSVCVLVLLCVSLTMGDVRGPCRHSLTKDHLLHIRRLMNNQLQSGCTIAYTFIERGSLSKVCYVKAALPWILDLFSTHFRYTRNSENSQRVRTLRAVILNLYSQQCIPAIDEELEEDPVAFERQYKSSPIEALLRVEEVLAFYLDIISQSRGPVDWKCETEYAQHEVLRAATSIPPTDIQTYLPDISVEMSAAQRVKESYGESNMQDYYKLGFVAMTACCGVILPLTICCFVMSKNHERILHRHQATSGCRNKRLDASEEEVEMEELPDV
ncbi:macrophage colony-stimulating factor 1b [Denticeps clupeoides]|uniref:Colony stimulating factor 1b (macrophage) n=1 Tax=Denticeps clupeoides TaxID=299321 RepID=A0AAY4D2G0_9TELE|nr:uncharacterized protein LOC114798269 [Denticeps clupeoides]